MKRHAGGLGCERARCSLDRHLDRQAARQVRQAVLRLAETGQGDLLRLRPPLEGYRLRVRDWRVFLTLDEATSTLTVRRVRHRRDAYRG